MSDFFQRALDANENCGSMRVTLKDLGLVLGVGIVIGAAFVLLGDLSAWSFFGVSR